MKAPPALPWGGVAVLGPTCAWKSEVAALLAEQLPGEIISCDAMQVYRGMDIGTAKPSAAMRARAAHHLLDVLDIHSAFDANQFRELALACIAAIRARQSTPVIAGGSGLYAKALIYGYNLLPADEALARQLLAEYQREGRCKHFLDELRKATPGESVPRAVRENPRRTLRAVEVLRLTGKPPWKHHRTEPPPETRIRQFVILPTMPILRTRIETRTNWMLDNGWIEETDSLIEQGLWTTPTARQALGYRDVGDFLAGAIQDLAELRKTISARTVRYARRQRTWFRNQHPEALVIHVDDPNTRARDLAHNILSMIRTGC